MDKNNIRVRFAPSPTGFMHLGNVRSALINFLFAAQKNGTFILRIEDTDANRNTDPGGKQIQEDLKWLSLNYQEGPVVGGPYEPYYQSKRNNIYKEYLEQFIQKNLVYRCFCTSEELEKKRLRQLALKKPPHYDRACSILKEIDLEKKLQINTPFIWRFRLDHNKTVSFYDLAHKEMNFELKHFSDIPLTRQDGSFTFMFANFVDDVQMHITHIFRGEDHLTNTAAQVTLFQAIGAQVPIYWHLPIMCNKEGKKLSKRDFGFSLTDLKNAGYLPEAICNYLAIIGSSFVTEIMDMQELANNMPFNNITPTGQIKYDLEKLRFVNQQWIKRYDSLQLTKLCLPLLINRFPNTSEVNFEDIQKLINYIQPEMVTLNDCVDLLEFYFVEPTISHEVLNTYGIENYKDFFSDLLKLLNSDLTSEEFTNVISKFTKDQSKSVRDVFTLLRIAITGKSQGASIKDLVAILGTKIAYNRILKNFNII